MEAVSQAVKGSYAVLLHEPSSVRNPELYERAKNYLLGRSAKGIRWIFEARGLTIDEKSKFDDDDLLSLKNLDGVWQNNASMDSPITPLMRALRELIT